MSNGKLCSQVAYEGAFDKLHVKELNFVVLHGKVFHGNKNFGWGGFWIT